MPRQKQRRIDTEKTHPRLKLDDPDARIRGPSLHAFKDHAGQDAVSIWPFDPTYATQQRDSDGDIIFNGPRDFSQPWPTFAFQVYTVNPLSSELSEFLSPIVNHGRRSFRDWEWEPRDTEQSWRIDIYQQPLEDVHACLMHHKREVAHRSTITQSGFGGGPIHLYGKQANRARIVVLDPPNWNQKAIVLADFSARDKLPERCPFELDLAVCAVDNVGNTRTMHQAIQEWRMDATRDPWGLEASEQHSNAKPPNEPRITTVPVIDETSHKGTVESQDDGIVRVRLRKDEAAPAETKSRCHVFHLESAAFDSAQLGHSLLRSLAPFLPPGTSVNLLIHPSEPRIEACLAAFDALELPDTETAHPLIFAVVDKHDFIEESGILFVRVGPVKKPDTNIDFDTGKSVADSLPGYQKWNNEHAMTVWRTYDIKRAALEFAESELGVEC